MTSGSSDWDRQVAARRREADRRAREVARQVKEQQKADQAARQAHQQDLARSRSAALNDEIEFLDQILLSVVTRVPTTIEDLKAVFHDIPFTAGTLGRPLAPPSWQQFEPAEPTGLGRWFGMKQYDRDVDDARARFDVAVLAFERAESERKKALAARRREYVRKQTADRAEIAAHNQQLDARRVEVDAGEVTAVEWFVDQVLRSSPYPSSFPISWQVAYRPENRDVVVEFELPTQDVVPTVREHRYVRTRDAIDPVPRPVTEIKQRYARLTACIALRTLHEIFRSTPTQIVEAIIFNGRVSTIDRATGKQVRPHLVSVSADRAPFDELVLTEVDPAACLKHLNALISPNPFDLEAVEPFLAFDLKRFRFVDGTEELADLDSRRNLLKLSPTEFEHLVKDLFQAMGAEAWRTVPSKDGGVDAVATSKNLFFGGVCLIQAKRYTGLVGLEAVHALTGVMTDHNATTGVLVTTSWFSRTSEQFAQRNRIKLINGAELKYLIKEHLKVDVVPGTIPPKRLRASDNTQTGKPGPAATHRQ